MWYFFFLDCLDFFLGCLFIQRRKSINLMRHLLFLECLKADAAFTSQLTHGPPRLFSFWTLSTIYRRSKPGRMGLLFYSGGCRTVHYLLQNPDPHPVALLLYLYHNLAHCLQQRHPSLERRLFRCPLPPKRRTYRETIARRGGVLPCCQDDCLQCPLCVPSLGCLALGRRFEGTWCESS